MIKIKAGNARHANSMSRAIAKFPNAEVDHFRLKLIVHVLIRGSLVKGIRIIRETGGYFSQLSGEIFPCPSCNLIDTGRGTEGTGRPIT